MTDCDVLVLGAGHNGLGISALLAKEGFKVVNVEKNGFVGGLASNAHFWPGYTHYVGAWWLSFNKIKPVWTALNLDKYGPELFDPPLQVRTVIGEDESYAPNHLINFAGPQIERMKNDLGADVVEAMGRFQQFFEPFSVGIKPMMHNPPISLGQLMDRMPSNEARAILNQIFYGAASDIIDEYFPDKKRLATLRAALTASACYGFWGGPMTPGSALRLAYHFGTHAPEEGGGMFKFLRGGIGRLSELVAEAFKDLGGRLILNAEVKKILLEKDKAAGVQLANGDIITAKYVISSLDATATFIRLVGEANIPAYVAKQIKKINYRSHYMQAFAICSGIPEYKGRYEYFNTEG
jgi:phytoene dehydrogenase-like protein